MNVRKNGVVVTRFRITDIEDLDPITVYMEDYAPGKGGIVIECCGKAWANKWPVIGNDLDMAHFFISAGTEYLANKLQPDGMQRPYLKRIVAAVKDGLREHIKQGEPA